MKNFWSTPVWFWLCFLVLSSCATAPAPALAPAEIEAKEPSHSGDFELVSDARQTCVYAPSAKSAAEKKRILELAAREFVRLHPDSSVKMLCLALLKPASTAATTGQRINQWSYPGSGEQILDPGAATWDAVSNGEPQNLKTNLHAGYERRDAAEFVELLQANLRGPACRKGPKSNVCSPNIGLALKLTHDRLKVKAHPLDWLMAP